MDEERLRMRREMIQQARQGRAYQTKKSQTPTKQFFLFRVYVTMMLVGAVIILSLFDTSTANTITESLKEAIAYEMPLATIEQWKQKAISVFQQNGEEIETQPQQNTTEQQVPQQQIPEQTQQSEPQKSNTFQPDLNEDSGKIP